MREGVSAEELAGIMAPLAVSIAVITLLDMALFFAVPYEHMEWVPGLEHTVGGMPVAGVAWEGGPGYVIMPSFVLSSHEHMHISGFDELAASVETVLHLSAYLALMVYIGDKVSDNID